jgi:hypothetical protein
MYFLYIAMPSLSILENFSRIDQQLFAFIIIFSHKNQIMGIAVEYLACTYIHFT